jgi:uncharacterized protein (TIGR03437 family)
VALTVGGASAEVLFAGLAPGLVGVYQVNWRVPIGARTGEQDAMLSVGGVSSPTAKVAITSN